MGCAWNIVQQLFYFLRRKCRSHVANFCTYHVVITDYSKAELMNLEFRIKFRRSPSERLLPASACSSLGLTFCP
jgi:hypothetical protein